MKNKECVNIFHFRQQFKNILTAETVRLVTEKKMSK